MATQEIVPVDEVNDELVTSEKKVEYSVKSEVISTVKTHETVTYVTEVRTESETVENHVQESIEGAAAEDVKPIENGVAEEDGEDAEKAKEEDEKAEEPKLENGEPSEEATPAVDVEAVVVVTEEAKVEATANGDEAAVESPDEETAEVTTPEEQEEIQEAPPKVILHQLPRVKGIVSRSPQCLAVETYLKMAEIPYENLYEEKAQDVSKENKGKIPYIEYKKTKVEGLKNCMNFLKKEFDVKVDQHLTKQDEAVAHAFRTMMEESTNWSLVYYRWVDNYGESKKAFSKLPPFINMVSPKMFQNKCKKSLESHVIGRHSREELYNIAEQDLCALSAFLDDKSYFLGDEPVSFDAIAFGLLANFDYGAENSPQQTLITERLSNLHEFCERMKLQFWLDWEDICGDEKFQEKPAKPSLVKRLSFRGNKKSRKPAAEGEKSEPTSPDEEKAATPEGGDAEQEAAKENGEQPVENGEAAETKVENGEAEEEKPKENGEDKKDDEKVEEEGEKKDEGESKSD